MKSHILVLLSMLCVSLVGSTFVKPSTCGTTAGCYHDCDTSGQCTFVVTWKENGINIDFTVKAVNSQTGDQWMGIGFSHDDKMGDDAVTECVVVTSGTMVVKNSFNTGRSNSRLGDPDTGITSIMGSHVNNVFQCSYSLQKSGTPQNVDLNNHYFLIFGSGPANADNTIRQHTNNPLVSSVIADFQSTNEIYATKQEFGLVIAHGSLMVIAWIFAVSIGVILPRFYKPMWPESKLFGEKVWFQLHRGLMMTAFLLTLIGFILIFVFVEDFSELNQSDQLKVAHPIIGVIVTALVFINPTMAIFRPHPGTKNRPLFNWAHWGVGTMAHILGVVNCFLGVRMGKPNIPEYVIYILAAFVVWHLLFELIMWMQQYCVNKKETDNYELQEGNMRVAVPQTAVQQNSGLKMFLLGVHVVVVFGFTLAVVLVMVTVDDDND